MTAPKMRPCPTFITQSVVVDQLKAVHRAVCFYPEFFTLIICKFTIRLILIAI